MDEFGSAFRLVSEVGRRKRVDAASASVPCFQYCYLFAGSPKLACCGQARSTRSNDDDGSFLRTSHESWV